MPLKSRKAAAVALDGAPPQASRRRSNPSRRAGAKTASRTGDQSVLRASSDEALIGRIAHGDRLAMHALYARHCVGVFRSVLGLVRDRSMAEDVISEVFLEVWRQADRFEGRSAVLTWMLGIARFKAFSALRNRFHEDWDEQAVAALEDPADDPAIALQKKDTGAIFENAWRSFRPRIARSSISSTTKSKRSRRSQRSSEFQATPSRRGCSARAGIWRGCSRRPESDEREWRAPRPAVVEA